MDIGGTAVMTQNGTPNATVLTTSISGSNRNLMTPGNSPKEDAVTIIPDDDNLSSTTEVFIVLPGPEDVSIRRPSDGLYQQSVTLTARMWPPIEAGTPKTVWGLPALVWGILIGCTIVGVLLLATLFFCCWLLPRSRKFLSPSRYNTNSSSSVAHHSSVVAKPWGDSNHLVMPLSIGIVPPQYSAPPPPPSQSQTHLYYHYRHNHSQQQHPTSTTTTTAQCNVMTPTGVCGNTTNAGRTCGGVISKGSNPNILDTHKSMWAINPLYASNTVLSETESTYRTRSLPSWGKGTKQRPVSTTDDLEELYAKVNFSKKRRNRMRNDEAAIIALCRSRSQNLASLPLEREGVVVYDERTAL